MRNLGKNAKGYRVARYLEAYPGAALIIAFQVLLVLAATLLVQGDFTGASQFGVYALYALLAGVVIQVISSVRGRRVLLRQAWNRNFETTSTATVSVLAVKDLKSTLLASKKSAYRQWLRSTTSVFRPRLYIVSLTIISLLAGYLELPQGVLPLGGDSLPLFNSLQLPRYLIAWNSWVDLGSSVTQVLAGPPPTDAVFYSILGMLGANGSTAAWLYVALFSIVGAIGTAYLFRVVFPGFRANQVATVLAGMVFLFNPSIVVDTFKSLVVGLPERAIFPLFLALFIDGHQKKKIRFAVASGMFSALLLARFPSRTDAYSIAILASTGAYVALAALWSRKESCTIAFTAKYIIATLATTFLANFYVFASAFANYGLYNSTLNSFTPLFSLNASSSFFNSVRLLGHWGFYAGYVPYSSVYLSNPIVLFATLSLPCFSFMVLLVDKTKRVIALASTSVLLVFFSKGNNEPLGQVFVAITSTNLLKVFYLASYLAPFVVLSYSLLVPAFFARIQTLALGGARRFGRSARVGILLILVSGMLIASWPIVTGDLSVNYYEPSLHGVTIPSEYGNLRDWLSSNANSYRTMLAYDPSIYISTDWGLQGATQFYQLYLSNAIVTGTGTQYSKAETFLDFIYHTNHFVILQPNSTTNLDAVTASPWSSYQGDNVSISQAGYNSRSAINWQIRSGGGTNHEISYVLPSGEDWSSDNLLALWVNQSVDISKLSFGIGDNRGSVGWYSAITHVGTAASGWDQILLPLRSPDASSFNSSSVNSLWAIDRAPSSFVDFSFFQLGRLGYNAVGWAKLLAIGGVKWVIQDESLVQGKWQNYGILDDKNAFAMVYHQGFLSVYENMFTPSAVYGATTLLTTSDMLNAAGSVNQSSFDLASWAFVLNSNSPIPQFSSSGSAQVSLQIKNGQTYDIVAASVSPFVLVFNQQFDPRWVLADSNGLSYAHIEVNGYANGWIISTPGTFDFVLTFGPQDYYTLSLLVSIVSIIVAAWIIVLPRSIFTANLTSRNRLAGAKEATGSPQKLNQYRKQTR